MDQHNDETPDAEVIAGDGGSVRTDAQRPLVLNAAPSGAQPSNTAPDNCIKPTKPLRWGIDSLYLSYAGQLCDEWFSKLTDCKTNAQSENPHEHALAQVSIAGHLFEVAHSASFQVGFARIEQDIALQFRYDAVFSPTRFGDGF